MLVRVPQLVGRREMIIPIMSSGRQLMKSKLVEALANLA
jgi:hypothetical protein